MDWSSELEKGLSRYFRVKHFHKGEVLWHEGDRRGWLVRLKKGRVKIYRIASNGSEVTLFIMKPNDIFGFLPLIDNEPYPVSAKALDDLEALVISHDLLSQIIKKDTTLTLALLRYLAGYLRISFDGLLRLSATSAQGRVASALLGLAAESGEIKDPEPTTIRLPISAKEFASLLGLTPESFSRKIKELTDLKIIEKLGDNKYRLINQAKLEELSEPKLIF
ncbi:MAG: Crp/Fnr family transcriptional regulator [Candidatus Saccharicenans sp.]